MTLYVFVNEELRMTSKILANSEGNARKMLPSNIEWTLKKEAEE